MPINNNGISDIFNRIADFLEIKGDNRFRIRAYRNAARTIEELPKNIIDIINEGKDLSELPGIGKDLAKKIIDIAKTGKCQLLKNLERSMPKGLTQIMDIPGMGSRRVKILYEKLGIKNIKDLEKAARNKKIRELPGFASKVEYNILEGIKFLKSKEGNLRLATAEDIAEPFLAYLKKIDGVKHVIAAGSYRRRKETVRDLDILATSTEKAGVVEKFVDYDDVKKIISKGETRASVMLRSGLQVDLRVVRDESYGAALQYLTGSKAHSVALRTIAVKKGLKINEYGVFSPRRGKGEKRISGKTEKEVYRTIGLPYIEPELRENRGEIEAAQKNRLPKLICLEDICGDLHMHTNYTDGRYDLKTMVRAAQQRGYEYIGITDHSKHVTVAHGLDVKRLIKQIKEINALNKKLKGIVVLKGVEVDILEDGSLDLPDSILKELDYTICAVHSRFNLPRQKQTERIIKAMDNPYFNIFAHPSGRLINERNPYELDLEKVMESGREKGCLAELNAHPKRLDLTDIDCKMAKELGIKVVISTDSHGVNDLDYMRFGIYQARRGWLESKDVLNTRKLADLRKILKRK